MLDIKIILNIFYPPSTFIQYLCKDNFLYYPINGGSTLATDHILYPWLNYDNTGDNISKLNSLINELTSIYWFWKNYDLSKLNYIGFNHYRRLFNVHEFKDYSNYDIIVMNRYQFNSSIYQQYSYNHFRDDIDRLVGILSINNLAENFIEYITITNELFAPCNLFIMKKDLFIEYCNFIFPLVFKLVNKINIVNRTAYQSRAIAFLSERLTSYWIYSKYKTNFKLKEIPIEFISE